MKERIKELRKFLRITQQQFAERIGTTQNNIANYEIGRRNPSAAALNNICKEFNVNEEWLRTGEGAPFVKRSRDEEIHDFVKRALRQESDSFQRRLVAILSQLDVSDWELLVNIAVQLSNRHNVKTDAETTKESSPDISSTRSLHAKLDEEHAKEKQTESKVYFEKKSDVG